MDVQNPDAFWPPSIGDYVRLRRGGVLGEVIDIAFTQANSRYTVNVFSDRIGEPMPLRLDDLESIWQDWPSAFAAHGWQREAPDARHTARPS